MSSLYEIKTDLLDCVDTDTGEILDIARFDDLQMEYETKIENIALWVKNLAADAEAYKNEKNAFADREKKAKAKAESLKQYLADTLNGRKFSTINTDISWRKSKALDYDGVSEVPEQYLKQADPTIDKAAVTADIKAGATIEGFELVERNNISIK